MSSRLACLAIIACLCVPVSAADLQVRSQGVVALGGLELYLVHFGPGWSWSRQGGETVRILPGYPRQVEGGWDLRGRYRPGDGRGFDLEQQLVPTAKGVDYRVAIDSPDGIPTELVLLAIDLPVADYAGKAVDFIGLRSVTLPADHGQDELISRGEASEVRIPTAEGTLVLSGPLSVGLTDNRRWNTNTYTVRLYLDPSAGKPLQRASLATSLSLSGGRLGLRADAPDPTLVLQPAIGDPDFWVPYDYALTPAAGGPLDFSFLLDAPAGKYGRVEVRGDDFVFADRPEQPVRFYGTNVVYGANFPAKEDAALFTDQLARIGYNALRFHHFDDMLRDRDGAGYFDAERLDRMDHLVHCAKQRGIYLSIDIYCSRKIPAGTLSDHPEGTHYGFKGMVPIMDSAMADWQRFARELLEHVNPYTGVAWKDEPALTGICLINEGNIFYTWGAAKDRYREAFDRWLTARGEADLEGDARKAARFQFLVETGRAADRQMSDYLRELGCQVPLTSTNYMNQIALSLIRQDYDYVDNHLYWDHSDQMGDWALPWKYDGRSALAREGAMPRENMPSRIFGKPFAQTEVNFLFPNRYRSEGGPLLAAYACLQDWDALYHFGHGGGAKIMKQVSPTLYFDSYSDPIGMLAERISLLAFQRSVLEPAGLRIPFLIGPGAARDHRVLDWEQGRVPEAYRRLGLVAQVGTVILEDGEVLTGDYDAAVIGPGVDAEQAGGIPAVAADDAIIEALQQHGVLPADAIDGDRYRTADGRVTLDADGGFVMRAPSMEAFVVYPGKPLAGDVVSVADTDTFCSVAVIALDGEALARSRHLLVLHLTDSKNTGQRFRSDDWKILEEWGELPHLVRAGTARVHLQGAFRGAECWSLDHAGQRRQRIAIERAEGGIVLPLDTRQPDGACLA